MIKGKLSKIEIDVDGNISFFFEGSDEPFVVEEFEPGSPTRSYLRHIQVAICAPQPFTQESLFEISKGP